jgi:Tfp pilus assembly protein PilO
MIRFSVVECVLFLVLVAAVAYQFRFRVQNRRREKLEQEFNKGPE